MAWTYLALEREVSRLAPRHGFKRYIALVQFDTDYYYTAYPRATTNDVKAAHRVHAAVEDFAARARTWLSPAISPVPT